MILPPSPAAVRLQPFHPKQDQGLLSRWLHSPPIARWFGDPNQQLQICLDPPEIGGHVLIYVQDQPVGYIRWQPVEPEALAAIGLTTIPAAAAVGSCSRTLS